MAKIEVHGKQSQQVTAPAEFVRKAPADVTIPRPSDYGSPGVNWSGVVIALAVTAGVVAVLVGSL